MDDIVRLSLRISSSGARYHPETREFALELPRTCWGRALQMVRAHIALPSRETLCRRSLVGCSRLDLANMDLATARVRAWRSGISDGVRGTYCPRCTLACDALACKRHVEVAKDTLIGLNVTDFDLNYHLLESSTSSSGTFRDFIRGEWNRGFHVDFVFQPSHLIRISERAWFTPNPHQTERQGTYKSPS
jgi:hypothetical protein